MQTAMKQHARPIGCSGTTVEEDESEYGKMKNHEGRLIEGQLVFGAICHETKACSLVPGEPKYKDTLLSITVNALISASYPSNTPWVV